MEQQNYSVAEVSIPDTSRAITNQKLFAQLKYAVSHRQRERIESLLQQNSPVNGVSQVYDFRSPLLSSVYMGDPDVVQKLLEKGASVNVKNFNHETAVTLAAKCGKYNIVDLLLKADGLQNCRNLEHLTHLHVACMRNNVAVVKNLILNEADINAAIDERSLHWPKFTPLHFAVQFQCIETVEYLLSIGANITNTDVRQLTPLHLAHMQRSEQIIDMILLAHLKVVSNPVNSYNLSHFHIACTRNNPVVVEFFIKNGADINACISHYPELYPASKAIDLAIYYECVDVVRLLLNYGSHFRAIKREIDRMKNVFDTENTELISLLLEKHKLEKKAVSKVERIPDLRDFFVGCTTESVKDLLSNLSNSFNSFWNGNTLLHLAVHYDARKTIEFLIDQGADYSMQNNDGKSPLHLAFERNTLFNDPLVGSILRGFKGTGQNFVNDDGLSHLHILCTSYFIDQSKVQALERFIELGFDVNSPVNKDSVFWSGFGPLHFAASFSCSNIVRILLSHGANCNAVNSSGLSAFDLALEKLTWCDFDNVFAVMEEILPFHSERELPLNDHGYSLLHMLSANRKTPLIRLKDFIIEHPSDINKVVSKSGYLYDGYTPLHFAMRFGHQQHAKLLVEMGADILAKNVIGDTPLHLAFESYYWESTEIPMSLQDPNILKLNPVGSTGYSLFHIACGLGNIEMMKNFLEHGVDVNLLTSLKSAAFQDRNPLHVVMRQNPVRSVEAIKLLLENGANVNARDSRRNTPLHVISRNDHVDLIDLLISHGADVNARNMYMENPMLGVCVNAPVYPDRNVNEKLVSFFNHGADINQVDEKGVHLFDTPIWDQMTRYDEFSRILNTLCNHLVELEAIDSYVSSLTKRRYDELVYDHYNAMRPAIDDSDYKDRCFKESERMMETYTDNYTSLHDILFKSLNELAVISENDVFAHMIEANDFLEKFPIYGPMLQSQFKKGQARRPLLQQARKSLISLTNTALPESCTEAILQSFTNEELYFLIISTETSEVC